MVYLRGLSASVVLIEPFREEACDVVGAALWYLALPLPLQAPPLSHGGLGQQLDRVTRRATGVRWGREAYHSLRARWLCRSHCGWAAVL